MAILTGKLPDTAIANWQQNVMLAQNTQNPTVPAQQVQPVQPTQAVQDPAALLQSMRDIHLPETSGNQFAPGWVLLAAGGLLLLVMLLGFLLRRRGSADWRHEAQQELEAIRQQASQAPDHVTVAACSRLLRRVSLALAPRQKVASMTGESWLNLLDALHGSARFTKGEGRLLTELPYARPARAARPPDAADQASAHDRMQRPSLELITLVEDFIAKAQPAQGERFEVSDGHLLPAANAATRSRQVTDG